MIWLWKNFNGFYNAETNEYYIKVENENGYEKELEYVIDLSEISEILEVYLYKYYYYESVLWFIGLIVVVALAFIVINVI